MFLIHHGLKQIIHGFSQKYNLRKSAHNLIKSVVNIFQTGEVFFTQTHTHTTL
jgi:hypothetical protein